MYTSTSGRISDLRHYCEYSMRLEAEKEQEQEKARKEEEKESWADGTSTGKDRSVRSRSSGSCTSFGRSFTTARSSTSFVNGRVSSVVMQGGLDVAGRRDVTSASMAVSQAVEDRFPLLAIQRRIHNQVLQYGTAAAAAGGGGGKRRGAAGGVNETT